MEQIENSLKTSFAHKVRVVLSVFILSIFASQCFASSSTSTSSTAENRRYMEMMGSVLDFMARNYVDEVDPEILYKGAIKGMLESVGDPYTLYLDTSSFRSLSDTTEGTFGGVGLSISKPYESTDDKPAYVEVASPIEDTPGFRAGIQAGDLIISVDGTDTSTITMEEVLSKLRGKVGENVNLVIRRGKSMEFPVTLTRALIEVPCEKHAMIGTIGYMRLIEFTPQLPEHVQQALDEFEKNNYTGLIIDLRNNPGGLINSAVEVADKFIDNGPIVSTKSRLAYENAMYTASPRKTTFPKGKPVVVLINKGSASASEILSGALKDNHLAYLVGQRTYGKGSVQKVFPMSATDGIKITMARYYSPSDCNIDKIGIPPDKEILFPELTEEAEKQYETFLKADEIGKYVEAHPNMSEKDISAYAKTLSKKYKAVDERSFRKLIRNQVNRKKVAPIYDLDYDIQLNEALSLIRKNGDEFQKLLKNTKTLKELQDEVSANEKKTESKK